MNQETRDYYLHTMGIVPWVLRQRSDEGDLSALQATVANCQACSLHHSRTQVVFGSGDVNARLMVVGEAPGYHEDQKGEPFVGRAGLLLSAMLKSIGIQRNDIYIANVLKCRPPQNRDPKIEEVVQCTKHLQQQIALIKPSIILAVGKHAANYLLQQDNPLYKLRNDVHTYQECRVIVSYHPAYLLRNPIDKAKAYQDLLLVKRLLEEEHEKAGLNAN